MSLAETRLNLAVQVANHAFRTTKGTDVATRTAAFRDAYTALGQLKLEEATWTSEVLSAAWNLVRDAYPNGGPISAIVADLTASYTAIAETVRPPAGSKRKKPKRDA